MAKKAKAGKPPAANALAGTSNYVAKAAGFNTGGVVAAAAPAAVAPAARATGGAIGAVAEPTKRKRGGRMKMPMGGANAIKRLDRPGRKSGGAIGADTSPLTTAANLSVSGANKV